MIDDLELLRLIENNARLSSEEIAVMLGTTAADVEAEISRRAKNRAFRRGCTGDHTLFQPWKPCLPKEVRS